MPYIQIHGIRESQFFPDSLSPEELQRQVSKRFQEANQPGFFKSILDNAIDAPRRTVSSIGSMAKLIGTIGSEDGFGVLDESPERVEQRRRDLRGMGFDAATLGLGAMTLGAAPLIPATFRLAGIGARTAGAGLITAPAFTPSEKAADPQVRAKEIRDVLLFSGALPIVGQAAGKVPGLARVAKARLFPTKPVEVVVEATDEMILIQKTIKGSMDRAIAKKTLEELAEDGTISEATVKGFKVIDDLLESLPAKITVSQLDEISKLGNYSKATRDQYAKILSSQERTVVSSELIVKAQQQAGVLLGQVRSIVGKMKNEGDLATRDVADILAARINDFDSYYRGLRSEAGRSLQKLRRKSLEFRNLLEDIDNTGKLASRTYIAQDWWKTVKADPRSIFTYKGAKGTIRDFVRYWTTNIFPIFSPVRDLGTNSAALGAKTIESGSLDLFDFIMGTNPGKRLAGILHSIRYSATRGATEQVNEVLRPTFLGELHVGIFGPKLDLMFFPALAKRSVDTFFKRLGAMSVLYRDAGKEAWKLKLTGSAKTEFMRKWVINIPDDLLKEAVETGNKLGFNRDISKIEQAIASSAVVRLFVNPFPRWTFQLTRFLAEHSPFDPGFWGKVIKGKATSHDVVGFLTRSLTGWAGVQAANELFYDDVDFKTMEYVREDKSRVRLTGLSPLPEALALVAFIRGDAENALFALKTASLPFPGAEGILGRLGTATHDFATGVINPETVKRELWSIGQDFIPGKGMMEAMTQAIDIVIRENRGLSAIARSIPGISKFVTPRIDPTTGEVAVYSQRIPIIGEVSRLRSFPGAARVTTEVEAELFRLGFGVRRPRRLPFLEIEDLGLGPEIQLEYEKQAGRNVGLHIGDLINASGYRDLTFDQQYHLVRNALAKARLVARERVIGQTGIPRATIRGALEAYLNQRRPQTR